MTGESLKPVLPRNHTAPSGRRLSKQTGSPNLICAPPIERWSQVIGALGVSCAVALAKQALSTHSYSVGPTRGFYSRGMVSCSPILLLV